jgi:lipopolysaccharide export system permease protein
VKKIDIYLIKRFIPLFFMTSLICIIILLMQFLWRYVTDLVGKGIGLGVLAEFFIYATLSTVTQALPLAILLASLMTFGNLGERFELTAMKSAGISLFRIMRPLILLVFLITVGAFYFSNNISPVVQKKLWSLVFSLRNKSLELEIPPGEFYHGIDGYSVYVRTKDGRLLKDMMIYDFSNGFNNANVTLADSGYIQLTADNKYLMLTLHNGESFENIESKNNTGSSQNIPYRRETFASKQLLIDFDTDFNRYDESVMDDQSVSKNIVQLKESIDSATIIFNNRAAEQAKALTTKKYLGRNKVQDRNLDEVIHANIANIDTLRTYNADSLFAGLNPTEQKQSIERAYEIAKNTSGEVIYNRVMLNEAGIYMRRHKIDLHRKFTLSLACLIFFFIGAPLGAIIRKGGFGISVIISVVMFVIFYIFDNTGYKMARDALWEVYQGMWLSSAVLLPVGLFLTYKATKDSVLFNAEQYQKMWQQIKEFYNKLKRAKNNGKQSQTDYPNR